MPAVSRRSGSTICTYRRQLLAEQRQAVSRLQRPGGQVLFSLHDPWRPYSVTAPPLPRIFTHSACSPGRASRPLGHSITRARQSAGRGVGRVWASRMSCGWTERFGRAVQAAAHSRPSAAVPTLPMHARATVKASRPQSPFHAHLTSCGERQGEHSRGVRRVQGASGGAGSGAQNTPRTHPSVHTARTPCTMADISVKPQVSIISATARDGRGGNAVAEALPACSTWVAGKALQALGPGPGGVPTWVMHQGHEGKGRRVRGPPHPCRPGSSAASACHAARMSLLCPLRWSPSSKACAGARREGQGREERRGHSAWDAGGSEPARPRACSTATRLPVPAQYTAPAAP